MSTMLYDQGYKLEITSWENDGDNYNTVNVCYKSAERAQAVYEFCQLFKSCNSAEGTDIGNMFDPDERIVNIVKVFIEANPAFLPDGVTFDDYHDAVNWALTEEAWDLGLTAGEFYRVCESVKVMYFSEPVYAEDMTEQFKRKG